MDVGKKIFKIENRIHDQLSWPVISDIATSVYGHIRGVDAHKRVNGLALDVGLLPEGFYSPLLCRGFLEIVLSDNPTPLDRQSTPNQQT